MPSIFEKPSILGFRQNGGAAGTPEFDLAALERSLAEAEKSAADAPRRAELEKLRQQFNALAATARGDVQVGTGAEEFYPIPITDRQTALNQIRELMPQIRKLQPVAPETPSVESFASMFPDTGLGLALDAPVSYAPAAPAATPSMFATPSIGTVASMFPNMGLGLTLDAPVSNAPTDTAPAQPATAAPAGTRAANVQAAMESGDFGAKRAQYNQEAMRMGHPSMMDEQGNIVGRELTQNEQMREFFNRTGGNTPFMQTNDPAQRALQNEMMKQARGQAAANTFGSTPEERRANLEAEVEARRILASPLDSGVREVAPGVRGAFRNGQTVGFSTPGDGVNVPKGTIKDPITGEEIPVALYNEMTRQTQATKGMTGGSPMERGLIAAMAAEEEARKKKELERAESAKQGAIIAPQIASNIARGFSPGAQVGGFLNDAMQQARR